MKASKTSTRKPAAKATKAAAKAAATAKTPPPDPVAALIAETRAAAYSDTHPERCFRHFRPVAEAVSLTNLNIFTGQPLLMRANVIHALEAIEPHLPAAMARLRDAPLREVFELPSLTLALDYAVGRVPVVKLSSGDIAAMLSEGGPWRELMLKYLEVVSHPLIGLVPEARVRAIRAGSGKLDTARDFVALPGVFTEFRAALARKHPFPEDKLEFLGTLGSALVQEIKPGRARTPTPRRSAESILRDQLAALVEQRYDALQVLAAVAVGRRKADELLPPLRSAVSAAEATAVRRRRRRQIRPPDLPFLRSAETVYPPDRSGSCVRGDGVSVI